MPGAGRSRVADTKGRSGWDGASGEDLGGVDEGGVGGTGRGRSISSSFFRLAGGGGDEGAMYVARDRKSLTVAVATAAARWISFLDFAFGSEPTDANRGRKDMTTESVNSGLPKASSRPCLSR